MSKGLDRMILERAHVALTRGLRPLTDRTGKRGRHLLLFSVMCFMEAALVFRHHGPLPSWWLLSHGWVARVVGWTVVGVLTCWAAFRRQGEDTPGWNAAYLACAWVVFVILDHIAETVILGAPGNIVDALLNGGLNFVVLGWTVNAAGWREPVQYESLKPHHHKDGGPR